ncbi:MAG TPA: hypothetical protein VGM88_10955 [Kofleriaceae bacterium]
MPRIADDDWRFLRADLRAAAWVREPQPADDDALVTRFCSLHLSLVRGIGRERPDLHARFLAAPRALFAQVVRQWIALYGATLDALAARHPRDARDLALDGTNWSELLGISYAGLLAGASDASRYAEYWAEKSMQSRAIHDSYAARLAFVGTPRYWRCHELTLAKDLVVVDALDNAIPSFDLCSGALDPAWRVVALSPTAQFALVAETAPA